MASIDWRGEKFRSLLTHDDLSVIGEVQAMFHACQYLGVLLYYLGAAERPRKFPASISYTLSKGLPKYTFMSIWLAAWMRMLRLMLGTGHVYATVFTGQMVATGVLTMFVYNEPEQGRFSDLVHFFGTGAYMVDHVVLLWLLNTRRAYCWSFFGSFGLMSLALYWKKRICRRCALGPESETPREKWQEQLAAMAPGLRRQLWLAELTFMVFENSLFTTFVSGMGSGLPELKA
uniref:Uncharacterized protein n=1 Tax=Alexandrium catenella TaxID=2925 RepID=A0A7S1Q1K5_ALECA|mmetsp:Transcript_12861/g.35319  ORF Transcript_12861/g.35319 Transcript_12861/m.35319 type:complete len:232 (+) Transcript_12861:96-791(+)